MHVLLDISSRASQADYNPYRPPVKNNAKRPILSFRFSCKSLITKSGAINVAKSVKIQGIGPLRRSTCTFPQCLGIIGPQFDRIGEHMKASAAVRQAHHRSMMTPRTHTVIRKLRVIKIRWRRQRTESFAVARAVV